MEIVLVFIHSACNGKKEERTSEYRGEKGGEEGLFRVVGAGKGAIRAKRTQRAQRAREATKHDQRIRDTGGAYLNST